MPTRLSGIFRQGYRGNGPYNILTLPTHERYQSQLDLTGHNFYMVQGEGIKKWNTKFAPIPPNHTILPNDIPIDIDFDFIFSQSQGAHFQLSSSLAANFHCPLITLEHLQPPPFWSKKQVENASKMVGDINIFITESSRKGWLAENKENCFVIHHGIDHKMFIPKDKQDHVLAVCNDMASRDWQVGFTLWKEIHSRLLRNGIKSILLGTNPGISNPAKNTEELATTYGESLIFLNTSLISPVPMALFEAMSAGCACVSTNPCAVPEILEHEVNGLMYPPEQPEKAVEYIKLLRRDKQLALRLGVAARKSIEEKFSL